MLGSTYDVSIGFQPEFVYIYLSNGGAWLQINNKQYSYYISDGSYYGEFTDLFYFEDNKIKLNTKYDGLLGLSGTIYAVKNQ